MGEITSGCTFTEGIPNAGYKKIIVETANTADTADTIVVDLSDYGISSFEGIIGYVHTTENSVVVQEQPTTSVSSGELTITVGGSTVSDKKRVYEILGK
jgi:type 1 fimbria pilin